MENGAYCCKESRDSGAECQDFNRSVEEFTRCLSTSWLLRANTPLNRGEPQESCLDADVLYQRGRRTMVDYNDAVHTTLLLVDDDRHQLEVGSLVL
jgi:hypothetical protein